MLQAANKCGGSLSGAIIVLLFCLYFCPQTALAQKTGKSRIDSLIRELATAKKDTTRCNIYYELSFTWLNRNPVIAEGYAAKLMALAQKTKWQKGLAQGYKNYADIYRKQPDFHRSLDYYKKSLQISESINATALLAGTYNDLGNLYNDQVKSDDAVDCFKKSVAYAIKANRPELLVTGCGRAGFLYWRKKDYNEEFTWLNQMLKLAKGNVICTSLVTACIGDALADQKNYKSALKSYQAAEKFIQNTNSDVGKGIIANYLALYYGAIKDTANMILYFQRSASYFAAGHSAKEATALHDLGLSLRNDEGITYMQKSASIYSQNNDDNEGSEYLDITDILLNEKKLDLAFKNFEKAIEIGKRNQNKVLEAYALIRMGSYLSQFKHDYSAALKYFESAQAIYGGEKLVRNQIGAFFSIANTYVKLKDYSKGLFYLKQTAELTKRLGDKAANNTANMRIEAVYTETHNYKDAIKLDLEIEKYYTDVRMPFGILNTDVKIAFIFGRIHNFTAALTYAQKAFNAVKNEDSEGAIGTAMMAVAEAAYNLNQYTQSLNFVKSSLAMKTDFDKGGAYNTLGLLMRDAPDSLLARQNVLPAQRYAKALEYLKTGHDLLEKNDDLDLDDEADYWKNLSSIYEKQKDYDNAYAAYRKHIVFRDSSDKESDQANFKQNETRFNFARHEDSVKYQEQLTAAKLQQQTLLVTQQRQNLTINQQQLSLANRQKDLQQADLKAKQSQLAATRKAQEATQANFELQKTELNSKRTQSRYFIGGLVALVLLSFFIARNYYNQRKANAIIVSANKEAAIQKAAAEKSLQELKTTQSQLVQAEKLASLGELTAGIAHEIQNPLNFVNNFSDVSVELVDEMEEELANGDTAEAVAIAHDIKQNLEKIRHHGKRADAIVRGMLEHSRTSTGKKEPANLNKLADEYLRLAYHGLRAKDKTFNTELITHFDESLPLFNIIPQDIGRVMLNLFTNAFYAVQQRQKTAAPDYKPTVEVSTTMDGQFVIIKVKDNGTGIPDEIKDKILQPFFTTKPTGEGTGLGLSLSYDIVVKGHGGHIVVDSAAGNGSEFTVFLPFNATA